MSISDEAVEAAAHIIAQESLVNAAMDGYGWDPENDSPEPFMPHAREQARRYLEAAAPHMLADAASRPDTQQIGTLPAEDQPNKPYSPNTADVITTNPYRSQS